MTSHKASAWLVIKPTRSSWNPEHIRGARIVRLTKRKPTLGTDEVAIQVTVRVPESAFDLFLGSTEIDVQETQVVHPTIEIEEQA